MESRVSKELISVQNSKLSPAERLMLANLIERFDWPIRIDASTKSILPEQYSETLSEYWRGPDGDTDLSAL